MENREFNFCPHCGTKVSDGIFCRKCGKALGEDGFCLCCGKKLDPDSQYCEECGTPISQQSHSAAPYFSNYDSKAQAKQKKKEKFKPLRGKARSSHRKLADAIFFFSTILTIFVSTFSFASFRGNKTFLGNTLLGFFTSIGVFLFNMKNTGAVLLGISIILIGFSIQILLVVLFIKTIIRLCMGKSDLLSQTATLRRRILPLTLLIFLPFNLHTSNLLITKPLKLAYCFSSILVLIGCAVMAIGNRKKAFPDKQQKAYAICCFLLATVSAIGITVLLQSNAPTISYNTDIINALSSSYAEAAGLALSWVAPIMWSLLLIDLGAVLSNSTLILSYIIYSSKTEISLVYSSHDKYKLSLSPVAIFSAIGMVASVVSVILNPTSPANTSVYAFIVLNIICTLGAIGALICNKHIKKQKISTLFIKEERESSENADAGELDTSNENVSVFSHDENNETKSE